MKITQWCHFPSDDNNNNQKKINTQKPGEIRTEARKIRQEDLHTLLEKLEGIIVSSLIPFSFHHMQCKRLNLCTNLLSYLECFFAVFIPPESFGSTAVRCLNSFTQTKHHDAFEMLDLLGKSMKLHWQLTGMTWDVKQQLQTTSLYVSKSLHCTQHNNLFNSNNNSVI